MKKAIRYAARGTGLGAVTYLIMMVIQPNAATTSARAIISLLLMSASIGVFSLIFNSELLHFPVALVIHMGVTLGMVATRQWYLNSIPSSIPGFLTIFTLIYVGVWGVVMFIQHMQVAEINRALALRNKNKQE